MASFEEDLKRLFRKYYLYLPVALLVAGILIGLGEITEYGIFNPVWIFLDVIMVVVLFGIVIVGIVIHERVTGPGKK